MTKAELIDKVAGSKLSMDVTKKTVGEIIDEAFDQIARSVKKEKRFTPQPFKPRRPTAEVEHEGGFELGED